jgi:methylglutamate dehydrogenase subunit B
MLIKCPHCGTRPVEEYTFLGDARPQRPSSSDPPDMDEWFDYVYLRGNPKGRIDEYAQHSGGCRAWLVVSRDTETHEVHACMPARDWGKARRSARP